MKSQTLPGTTGDFPAAFEALSHDGLIWLADHGTGYCRSAIADLYDRSYFDAYLERDASKIGAELTRMRRNFVGSHIRWERDSMVDVGIGGGRFCREADCLGTDVNPQAIDWLKREDRFFDLQVGSIMIATFWDSLEHIVDARKLLFNVTDYVFLSTPVYQDMSHVLRSKHYKPGEHVWYWTRKGIDAYMRWHGFELIGHSEFEKLCGREDIESFAFKRAAVSRL